MGIEEEYKMGPDMDNSGVEKKAAGNEGRHFIKPVIIGIVIIAVVCGAAFGIFKLIQSVDYMRPVRDICSVYNDRETDAADIYKAVYSGADKKAYSAAYKILANSDEYFQYYDGFEEELEEYYRNNAAQSGSNIKMKFDTTGDKVKMDESQLAIIYNEFEAASEGYRAIIDAVDNMGKDDYERMAEGMGISLKRAQKLGSIIKERCGQYVDFEISAGYYLTGRFVLTNKQGDTVGKTDKITVAVIKLNGSWYLYEGKAEGVLLATGSAALASDDILWDIYEKYMK